MISVNWDAVQGEIGALVKRYDELPRWIAKKHLKAAIGRTLRPGVPKLRALTPPVNTRRGRRKKGEKALSTNRLRKAVKVITRYKGRNKDGYAYGVIGYRAGEESLKALWLEFGTKYIQPRKFMQDFHESYKTTAQGRLVFEMRKALDAATKELNSNVAVVNRANAGRYRRPG